MAYFTGNAATKQSLFDALGAFLLANGFTNYQVWAENNGTTSDTSVPTGYTIAAFTDAGGNVFTFGYRDSDGYISMNYASSIQTGKQMGYQPGANPNRRNFGVAATSFPLTSYHFFYDGAFCHVVLEILPNIFVHFNFGMVTKNGSWSGGKMVTGTRIVYLNAGYRDNYRQNSFPFASQYTNGNWGNYSTYEGFMSCGIGASGVADLGQSNLGNSVVVFPATVSYGSMGWRLLAQKPNLYNGRAPMLPLQVTLSTGVNGGAPMYQLGHIPNVAFLNMEYLDPKTVINTDWMVFPVTQKNGNGTYTTNSGSMGIAYRK